MKITIERRDLLKGLQRVQGVVEKRNTLPVLSNILLTAENGSLSIFATDMETAVLGTYPADIAKEGKTTLSARKVYEITKELPEGRLTLFQAENQWVQIEAGKSRFKVAALPADDFPLVPEMKEDVSIKIPARLLSELFRKTVFAVGENDSRYILNGLLFFLQAHGDKTLLRFVGTDGHRLAVAEREGLEIRYPDSANEQRNDVQAVVPKKAIFEMKKLLEEGEDDLQISFAKTQVLLKKQDFSLYSRLMEGSYPNYSMVIPKGNDKTVSVKKLEMERALKRVSVFSREKTNAVHFNFSPGELSFYAQSPEFGEAEDRIDAVYQGEKISTGFNSRYVLEALSVIENEEIQIEMKDSLSPVMFKDPGDKKYLCVVMPMRI